VSAPVSVSASPQELSPSETDPNSWMDDAGVGLLLIVLGGFVVVVRSGE
jgi:hypothetical protein